MKTIEQLIKAGRLRSSAAKRMLKERNAIRRLKSKGASWRIFQADIKNAGDLVEPGSVDCIVTDPPYPKEYLPLWSALGEFASRALRPGGSLVALSGHAWLPEVMRRLGEHLRWWWIACWDQSRTGAKKCLSLRRVVAAWKPLLWYVKDKQPGKFIGSDVVDTCRHERTEHKWQQSIEGFVNIVEKWTDPGNVVCDPFLGSGTTGVACILTGRDFVGFDVDQECVDTSRSRMAGEWKEKSR